MLREGQVCVCGSGGRKEGSSEPEGRYISLNIRQANGKVAGEKKMERYNAVTKYA